MSREKGEAARQREIIALGVMRRRHMPGRQPLDPRRDGGRRKPGAVHEHPRPKPHRCRAAHMQREALAARLRHDERARKGNCAARILDPALKAQHEAMRVEYPGFGRGEGQRCSGAPVPARGPSALFRKVRPSTPVLVSPLGQPRQLRLLGGAVRHDELAAALMGQAVQCEVIVKHPPPLDAEPRLQAPRRVVDAAVNDFAVPRRNPGADGLGAFQHHDLATRPRQRPRDRQPHRRPRPPPRIRLRRSPSPLQSIPGRFPNEILMP